MRRTITGDGRLITLLLLLFSNWMEGAEEALRASFACQRYKSGSGREVWRKERLAGDWGIEIHRFEDHCHSNWRAI